MTAPPSGPSALVPYDWAVIRVVPRVHLGASVNVGVVVHARTRSFLDLLVLDDPEVLGRCIPEVDPHLLARYLASIRALARGEPSEGCGAASVALAPDSERFHWLTAPRSDILQASPVHGGLTRDPAATLARLFAEQVRSRERSSSPFPLPSP